MSFTHTITTSYLAGGIALTKQVAVSADGEDNRDILAGALATTHVLLTQLYADIRSFIFLSDQDVVVELNDPLYAPQSFNLSANVPFVWYSGCGMPNPIVNDITSLYITNAGAVAANVNIRMLADATP
jgi:hypothetical protein